MCMRAREREKKRASKRADWVNQSVIESRDIKEFYLSNVVEGNFKREKNEMHIYLFI